MSEILSIAEHYISQGIKCHPIAKGTKKPRNNAWSKKFLSYEQFASLYSEGDGIGIVTGHVSGIVCIDVDPRNNGLAWYEANKDQLGCPVIEKTGSGGLHLYYKYPQDCEYIGSATSFAPGIDILADGGKQVVTAPSSHPSGGLYEIQQGLTLTDVAYEADTLPDWLYQELKNKRHKAMSDPAYTNGCGGDIERATVIIASLEPAIEGRAGNLTTFKAACKCRDYGLTQIEAFNLLQEHFNPRCIPPWSDSDLKKIIRNAYKYAEGQLGGNLPEVQFQVEEVKQEKPKQDKTRFEKIDFVDFLTREIPPIEIILDPWLTTRSLNMMYAERGCGKTLIALAIAYSIASGKPFIPKWPVLKQTTVCYFDGEMSAAEFQERCRGINLASLEKGQFEIITNDFQPRGMPDFGTQEGQQQALDLIGDAEVVVIDNLSCLLRSGGPENDSESWGLFQEWLLMLKRLGKTVLFLHHAGKSGAQRGTSKREDQLNEVLGLKHPSGYRKSDGLWVQVKYEKGRRLFGQAAEPIEIKLETDILGKYIWKSLDVNKATKDKIISLLGEGMPANDIATELGVSGSYVRRVKRDLDKEGAEKHFNDESNDVF